VALANGLAWSLIVPPFQVPDENAHYAYVQQVAERGTLPRASANPGPLSPAQDVVLADLLTYGVIGNPRNLAPFSEVQQQVLAGAEAHHLSALGSGDALSATGNPPLYYALQAVPYRLAGRGVLDKLVAMRVLSALISAFTVLAIYLFLSELLPASPWAWTAGALAAAFQPLFAFMSAGVNNDSLLYLAGAGLLWAIARAFRRGLGPASGALIGGFLGLGVLAKFTLLGLAPAAALAVAVLLLRADRKERTRALQGAAWAAALSLAPLAVYALLSASVWDRGLIPGGVGSVAGKPGHAFSFREEVSHVWQLFLPRLWMRAQFSYYPLWNTWFVGFIGRFGWNDYGFAAWAYQVARVLCIAGGALALAELVRRRDAVRRRLGELAIYALALAGLCVVIGAQSYRYLIANGGVFEQARYLLPVLGLYAAVAALAVRAGGRRWGPLVGATVVLLAIGHDLWAQAITIARYYT